MISQLKFRTPGGPKINQRCHQMLEVKPAFLLHKMMFSIFFLWNIQGKFTLWLNYSHCTSTLRPYLMRGHKLHVTASHGGINQSGGLRSNICCWAPVDPLQLSPNIFCGFIVYTVASQFRHSAHRRYVAASLTCPSGIGYFVTNLKMSHAKTI